MKTAAVEFEKIEQKSLKDISAAEFIEGLSASNKLEAVLFLPEKKKVELEVEPGILGKLDVSRFVDILERFKGEKKKRELEVDPVLDVIRPYDLDRGGLNARLSEMNGRIASLEKKLG